jgi:uncharacterized membrane protein
MSVITRTMDRIEKLSRVDAPAGLVQRGVNRLFPEGSRIVPPLAGSWLGHPLHPALVLAPIGSWLSATVLDAVPGQQPAARRLVLTGLAAAVPAVVTGAVEYRQLSGRQRRVGFVHLVANATAAACYAASYRKRVRGHTAAAQGLGLLGLAAVTVGGTLGGHLAYAHGVGVYRWQPPPAPTEEPAAPERYPVGGARARP